MTEKKIMMNGEDFKKSAEYEKLMKKFNETAEQTMFFGGKAVPDEVIKKMNATTAPEDIQEDFISYEEYIERISAFERQNHELRKEIEDLSYRLNETKEPVPAMDSKIYLLLDYLRALSGFNVDQFNIYKEVGRVTAAIEKEFGIDDKPEKEFKAGIGPVNLATCHFDPKEMAKHIEKSLNDVKF